ncbi:MAG: hypothetical protein ABSF98_12165 [Bryobacteraceae bacterium]
MDDPSQLPTLHDKVVRAHADVRYIAGLLAAPLSDQDRKACLKRAQHASRLLHEVTGLSLTPASLLGSIGGKKTAEHGPDYFLQIAAMRKTRGGGRPRRQAG